MRTLIGHKINEWNAGYMQFGKRWSHAIQRAHRLLLRILEAVVFLLVESGKSRNSKKDANNQSTMTTYVVVLIVFRGEGGMCGKIGAVWSTITMEMQRNCCCSSTFSLFSYINMWPLHLLDHFETSFDNTINSSAFFSILLFIFFPLITNICVKYNGVKKKEMQRYTQPVHSSWTALFGAHPYR